MYDYYDYYDSGYNALDLLNELMDSLETIFNAIAIVIAVISILYCLFGYKWVRFVMAVNGFLSGMLVGSVLGILCMADNTSGELSDIVSGIVLIMVICGIVGAVISYNVYKLGLFLTGFSGVYVISLLSSLVGKLVSGNTDIASAFFFSIIPAAIAGCIIIKFTKPILIIYTSLSGAYTAAISIAYMFNWNKTFIFIALAVAGIYYQIKSNDGITEHPERLPTPQPSPVYVPREDPHKPAPSRNLPVKKADDALPEIID